MESARYRISCETSDKVIVPPPLSLLPESSHSDVPSSTERTSRRCPGSLLGHEASATKTLTTVTRPPQNGPG